MNRSDLIQMLSDRANLTEQQAGIVIKTIFGDMTSALMREEKIEIRNFGVFHTKHYSGYQGRDPRTGKLVQVPDKRRPFFKVGKELAQRIQHALHKEE